LLSFSRNTNTECNRKFNGRDIAAGFPPQLPRFFPRPGHVRYVVNKMTLGAGLHECFDFLCQSFHHFYTHHHHHHHHHHLSSGAGTIGQAVADVQSGLRSSLNIRYSATGSHSEQSDSSKPKNKKANSRARVLKRTTDRATAACR
jgi:hypothetical protein